MFKMMRKRKILTQGNRLRSSRHLSFVEKGQVILEFTFCMIVILIMIYGVVKVFHWAGKDVVARQKAHDALLLGSGSPRQQIDPYFFGATKMNAVWDGN